MNLVVEDRPSIRGQEGGALGVPGSYEVYLHNDDFTPLAFVIESLERFFYMDCSQAKRVALEAHTKGVVVCGIYTREVAETRIDQAEQYARTHDHPLKWTVEAS